MMKSSYGAGCFALLNTGATLVESKNRLLGAIAYRLRGEVTYVLEGSIFIAGAVVQWLRDRVGLIGAAGETQALAENADPAQQVILVPAFTGLGAGAALSSETPAKVRNGFGPGPCDCQSQRPPAPMEEPASELAEPSRRFR